MWLAPSSWTASNNKRPHCLCATARCFAYIDRVTWHGVNARRLGCSAEGCCLISLTSSEMSQGPVRYCLPQYDPVTLKAAGSEPKPTSDYWFSFAVCHFTSRLVPAAAMFFWEACHCILRRWPPSQSLAERSHCTCMVAHSSPIKSLAWPIGLYPLANLADGSSALQLCRGMILRARPKLPSEWVAEAWPITIY